MENFRKYFIDAATKYADYIGIKISAAASMNKIEPESVMKFEDPLEAAKVLYEEMRTLNQTAEILGAQNQMKYDQKDHDN